MKRVSLTKALVGSHWLTSGAIAHADGSVSKAFEMEPLPSGVLEEAFEGGMADSFFAKLSDLLTKLPNLLEAQFLLCRRPTEGAEVPGFRTRLYCFEKTQRPDSYSHLRAVLAELKLAPEPLTQEGWEGILAAVFGENAKAGALPDLEWQCDRLEAGGHAVRVLSMTELPQVTWKGCLQSLFESPLPFTLSLHLSIPDRGKVKRKLETKRRVSHALSVTSSVEVRNIESNSVLHSSEETLERILVGKETLFEISFGVIIAGLNEKTLHAAKDFERIVSGIGNAGLFLEKLGTLPVAKSHIPGNRMLGIRKLPILSENLAHLLPLLHDFSRRNDPSPMPLRSRSEEVCHLNLFSRENLNFNALICGASGSGKSFLMNAILSSILQEDPSSRLCIFDVGGSYRNVIEQRNGKTTTLDASEAQALAASFLQLHPVSPGGFFRSFLATLCGSGPHITHSHLVAIDDLLAELAGERLVIEQVMGMAAQRAERYYQDVAHWLKPHLALDRALSRPDLIELIRCPVASFDFRELSSDPVLQRTTILMLSELLWRDLADGRHPRTLVVFDEVWRFFAQSKSFLEEMYRTLRKYRAGIVSITQNIADYGDESFAKMLFTTSFTKIFLQNGTSADFLRNTLDLAPSDIERALSVASNKPHYSEFFALTPHMSQVLRLYPTREFYDLANTENITKGKNNA